MKAKLFIGLAVATVAIAAATVFTVNHFSPKSQLLDLNRANIEALTKCEDSVDSSGGAIIVVTVCNRRTSWVGNLFGAECNKTDTTSCQFTNV
jgi:hypothetical protein